MDVTVAEIDPHDGEDLATYWQVGHDANAHERPYSTFWSLRAARWRCAGPTRHGA
jgi:hypothetical protein